MRLLRYFVLSISCIFAATFTAKDTIAQTNARGLSVIQESKQFLRSKKIAIVVGVNQYNPQSGLRPLRYAVSDAKLMEKVLKARGYTVILLTDAKANRPSVLDAIKEAGKLVHPTQGTLLFFFSGHGFAGENQQSNYLATSETISRNLAGSALSMKQVQQAIRTTGVRRAVMFIDACRDSPFIGKSVAQPSFIKRNSHGIKSLYATSFGDLSYETPSLKHGVFSHFLYRGLAGAAVEQDGYITFDSLKRYVQEETANWTLSRFIKPQTPVTGQYNENFGVFVLGEVRNVPKIRSTPTIPPRSSGTSDIKPIEPKMVRIPAGSFTMGCVNGRDNIYKSYCRNEELPAQKVNISSFMVSKYEVTFNEWDVCQKAKACPPTPDVGWGRGNRPVVYVSWYDAQKYLNWLNSLTGKKYRLLTESEWEYAARGGSSTAYPWGRSIRCDNANYGGGLGNTIGPLRACNTNSTKPVGSYAANRFGLYDTVGNVSEWVEDCYQDNYVNLPKGGDTRKACVTTAGGLDTRQGKVIRGGSWFNIPEDRVLRSAYRDADNPDSSNEYTGFRIARTH